MSQTPYVARFAVGSRVRVVSRKALEEFRRNWKLHNALTDDQLRSADAEALVAEIGYYHGGDPLYNLLGIAGIWHEQCLVAVPDSPRLELHPF